VTPYVAMKFDVSLEILLEPFSLYSRISNSIFAKWVHRNYSISIF